MGAQTGKNLPWEGWWYGHEVFIISRIIKIEVGLSAKDNRTSQELNLIIKGLVERGHYRCLAFEEEMPVGKLTFLHILAKKKRPGHCLLHLNKPVCEVWSSFDNV